MERFDVFVIGGGGTGSEVAFRLAAEPGFRIGIAERDKLGGECNHYGCVPTKVMLRSAQLAAAARHAERFGVRIPSVEVDFLAVRRRLEEVIASSSGEGPEPFERAGVEVFLQEARLVGPHRLELADGTALEADRIVLTTGTEAVIPPIPGLDGGPIWTNKEAIWEPNAAPGSLAIVGAGAIGIEFAQIYTRFGSKVMVIEAAPQILPNEDGDAAASVTPVFEAEGIELIVDAELERAEHTAGGWRLRLGDGRDLRADEVLVATGRAPVFDVHDLDAAGIQLDERGRPVLDEHLRTTGEDVWAAGDATGELLFTHVGGYEADLVVDDILGRPRARDYRVVPRVTFCEPEVASVGLTEQQARDGGDGVRVGTSRIADNERAHIDGRTEGLVKIVADDDGQILGGHIVATEAGAMIHEVVAMMAGRVPAGGIGDAIHAYPTLSESVRSALRDASTS
jgi:pyruvate/2-oxoglutarate dehydrogenase complex dihydrolipoamide dehydrogenase (E3) component